MKIAMVTYGREAGGAARAASRLATALHDVATPVDMYTADGIFSGSGERIEGISSSTRLAWKLKSKAASSLMRLQRSGNPTLHSPAFLSNNLAERLNRSDADIVNLHWVAGELMSIEDIGRISKPIVWTMHDSWAFSGSEHHQADDGDCRFSEGYHASNKGPRHRGADLDRWVWARKRRAWLRPMNIVTPGEWLASRAARSALMKSWPISVIPNPIPLKIYRPRAKLFARARFRLDAGTPYVMFSAAGSSNENKGWAYFAQAMTLLKRQGNAAVAVLLGGGGRDFSDYDFPHIAFDSLNGDEDMSLLYSAVDAVCVPSRVETFPQMATEALACATPVVAFRSSGLKDVVSHRETGFLASPFECEELANGIAWTLEPRNLPILSRNAERFAAREWSESVIASQYHSLFESLL